MGSPDTLEVNIEVAQLSDPGRDPNKQINEDSCGYSQTRFGHLCVLCDGMGGHYGGQEASRRAITTIFEQIEKAPETSTPAQALKYSIEVAARRVYELGGPADNKVRPGSTVVAMLMHDAGLEVAHVGDSRAYVIRSGQIYPLTRDHSMVQAMIDAGFLTEDQAIGHPDANKITRALGMKPDVEVEIRPEPMELFPGDLLITTSDGLTDLALGKDILGATRQAMASGGIENACQQLVRMANDRGGHDNITVQLVRVVATAPRKTHVGAQPGGATHTGSMAVAHAGATTMNDAGNGPVSNAGPTEVAAPRRMDTLSMHTSAATAHDGTSQASAAAGHTPHAPHSQAGHGAPTFGAPPAGSHATLSSAGQMGAAAGAATGGAPPSSPGGHAGHYAAGQQQQPQQGLQLPPSPQPMNQQLAKTLEHQPMLSDYRLDGVSGLQLPPMSTRYVGPQAVQHLQPAHGQAIQPAPPLGPSPPASSAGFGAPPSQHPRSADGSAWQAQGSAHAQGRPPQGGPQGNGADWRVPAMPTGVDSVGGRMGGNVLFLALTISFVVAVVVLALVWVLFLS